MTLDEVLGRLEREDSVPVGTRERAVEVVRAEPKTVPWYARGITGFYGWLAAAFLVAFVMHGYRGGERELAIGLGMLGAGIVARRFWRSGYLAHLSLAAALAGEVLAVLAMGDMSPYDSLAVPGFMLAIELLLFLAYPDSLMRLLSTFGVASASWRIWELVTHDRHADFPILVALAGALVLFNLRGRLERTNWRSLATPAAYGLTLTAFAWLLLSLEKYSSMSVGLVGRIGVAVMLFAQLAVVLRKKRLIAAAAVGVGALAAFSFGSPGVLAATAVLAVALHRREAKLVGAAAVFLALFYSDLYYSMHETLLLKSALMLGNGLCFLLLWRLLEGREPIALPATTMDRRVMVLATVGALLVVNGLIFQKERVLDSGDTVLLELGTRDPRALMQGDYMTLRYQLINQWEQRGHDGRLVYRVDGNKVASFVRWDDGKPLAAGEHFLRYRQRGGQLRLGAEAFFFQEGKGELYARARYGELRVTRRGDSVLVGLRDAERKTLGRALR